MCKLEQKKPNMFPLFCFELLNLLEELIIKILTRSVLFANKFYDTARFCDVSFTLKNKLTQFVI